MLSFFLWLFTTASERKKNRDFELNTFLHDIVFFSVIFAAAIGFSLLLANLIENNSQFSIPVFILAVTLIARFTQGYVWGICASVLGVVCVNYMFTYPYWEFDLTLTGYPLTFAAMLAVSLLISALTTRIKHEEQIRLEAETEKMRANLLRSVSHDLRTPLTSIEGLTSVLLENDNLSERQQRDLLQEINRSARWLTRVMENILSVTRINNQAVRLNMEEEVVEEIVSSAIVKFRRNPASLPVTVTKPDEILLAEADATLIEQVILNLFDNVIEHGEHATKIHVTIESTEGGVRVTIADDGAGIPAAKLRHLFDGHAQLESAQDDRHRNMGIGLSVCQTILQAHGGSIRAYNNPTGGASIEFTLPSKERFEDE